MNVSLTIDEKPGPLHAFAALDILVIIMLLGFVAGGLVHRSGVAVALPQSATKFPVANESLVLTVKGAVKPVFYVGSRPMAKDELISTLRRRRDEEGLRMVLVRADRRLTVTRLSEVSQVILSEGLECMWLGEPSLTAPAP